MAQRHETRQVWEERVTAWQVSGLSVRRFAEREGLAYRTMARWIHRVGVKPKLGRPYVTPPPASLQLVPIEIRSSAASAEPIEIRLRGGRVIAVRGEFDDERLARLIGLVERA